jgi:uncharacterized protein (TIGR00251 family)
MTSCYTIEGGVVKLNLKVTPGASKTEILDVRDGRLRVRVAAAPEDGKANAALISFFAKLTLCAKNKISVVSGEKSRLKTITLPESALPLLTSAGGLCYK